MALVRILSVNQRLFEIDSDDSASEKDALMAEIRELLDNIPPDHKLEDENTKINLRIFTRRC